MPAPITITLGREALNDGTPGYTVAIGGLSLLADSEEAARELAETLYLAIASHTVEEVRIRDTIDRRIAA